MKIKYILITLGLILVSYSAKGQIIQGRIIDSQTKEPLIGANVQIANSSVVAISDAQGKFSITPDSYPATLIISYVGYETISREVLQSRVLNIRMTASTLQLDKVVVSAFEGERRLIETPASIARVTSKDIERFDLRSPQQALGMLPGVKVESTTIGRYRIRIRGGSLGIVGHSDSYKMYWNGIPITLADGFPPLAYVDVGSIGTADVIRGPSGSIYGAGLAGVALFENKTGRYDQTKLEVDGLTGSYGTYRQGISVSTGGEYGDIRLQYGNVQTDGYREESSSNNEFLNLFGRVFPSEKQTISFLGIFGDRDYGIPGNLTAQAMEENRRQANFSPELDNGLTGRNLMIGVGNDYKWNNNWGNNTTLNYQVLEGTFLIGNDFFVSADQATTTSFALRNATTFSFEAFNNPARFVFGFEYTRGLGDVDVFSDGFDSPLISNRETVNELTLGFAQIEFELPEEFQVTIGGSYNNFRLGFQEFLDLSGINEFERNVQDFSPRIALVKPLKNNFVIHGNISKGFAPPPRSAFDNSNETVNENLESTIGWNKEVGLRGTLVDDKLSFDLTLYRLDESDVILPRVVETINNLDFIQNENAGAIDRQGVELALQYQLIQDGFGFLTNARWFGNYTYMDHTFEEYSTLDFGNNEVSFDGNQIPGVHPHTVVTGIDISSSIGLYFNGTYSFFDKIYLNNANDATDDSYQLVDLKVGIERRLGDAFSIDINGGINNALDDEYSQMHGLNSGFGGFFDPAMDRNYYAGIKLSYLFN